MSMINFLTPKLSSDAQELFDESFHTKYGKQGILNMAYKLVASLICPPYNVLFSGLYPTSVDDLKTFIGVKPTEGDKILEFLYRANILWLVRMNGKEVLVMNPNFAYAEGISIQDMFSFLEINKLRDNIIEERIMVQCKRGRKKKAVQ